MQKARRHIPKNAPTACRHAVSCTISLPFRGTISPFPHGTSPLSVTREYLALEGGPPRFRPRFTGAVLLRNPWTIGGGDSHSSFVTHAGILTSHASTTRLRGRFARVGTLSYRVRPEGRTPAASATSLSPVTFSALEHLTSELLRTLSRMAASKPTSWLSRRSDIVFHLAST